MQSNEENFLYPNSVYGMRLYPLIFHSLKAELSSETTATWFLFVIVFGTFSSLVIFIIYNATTATVSNTNNLPVYYFSVSPYAS